jgi:dihydrofolate reductase
MEDAQMTSANSARIIAIAAVTIDGRIAQNENQETDWTSPEDKTFLRKILDQTDVIVIGHTTYRIHQAYLAARKCIVFTHDVNDFEEESDNLSFCNLDAVSLNGVLSPYQSVALLGGSQIYTHFLEHDSIDELYLTIEPIIFGGGLNLFNGQPSLRTNFDFVSFEVLNKQGSVLLHYRKRA